MRSFVINEDLLEALDEYDKKSWLLQKHIIEKIPFGGDLQTTINDDLLYNVPIYDTAQRKFAAFSSLLEALIRGDSDIKGNGVYFKDHNINNTFDWFMLFYLFRLCGSGINYNPKTKNESVQDVLQTHGFGNFWIIDSILKGRYTWKEWKQDLIARNTPFTDNKGYLLPQFSYKDREMKGGHLKRFIIENAEDLVMNILIKVQSERLEIYQVTDYGNGFLNKLDFKKQNFVLTAFAADLAEYYPNLVNPYGKVYAGTNAVKCINAIFPKVHKKVKEFDYLNEVLQFLSERYGLLPIDAEDSRACDVVRYFQEYQSQDHILANHGVVHKNNSILKQTWGQDKYYNWANNLK